MKKLESIENIDNGIPINVLADLKIYLKFLIKSYLNVNVIILNFFFLYLLEIFRN